MNRLKELRKEKNISQNELAKKFNISQQTISCYENGTREPDTKLLKKFADFFDVSVDYLLGRTKNRKGIIEPEGNLNKDNIKYKTYDEIIKKLEQRLIEEKIIEPNSPIPSDVFEKILKYGQEAAIEILKTRKEQDS